MTIASSKRHELDGRTYHRILHQILIKDPMGSTSPEASRFLPTRKRNLNQHLPWCFRVSKIQVQRKSWHCRQAHAGIASSVEIYGQPSNQQEPPGAKRQTKQQKSRQNKQKMQSSVTTASNSITGTQITTRCLLPFFSGLAKQDFIACADRDCCG